MRFMLGFLAATAGPSAGPAPVAPTLTTLRPGGFRSIHQTLDVNIVFVAYEPGRGPRNINASEFGSVLPHSYRPAHRYPTFYQGVAEEMGSHSRSITSAYAAWITRRPRHARSSPT